MNSKKQTIIVGGGVIGAFCAWFLKDSDRDITIIDQGKIGSGCSHGNCGYVSPSHVLPLPSPGQIRKGIRGLFSQRTALRIQPRMSPTLWVWLLKFAARCNRSDMLEAGRSRHALLQSSAALYRSFFEQYSPNVEWTTDGLLFVFRDESGFHRYAQTDELLREEFGVRADRIDGAALAEREPALKPGMAGAWHYTGDAHLRPDRLMSEMKRLLQEHGVLLQEDTRVVGIDERKGRTIVSTDTGETVADEVVVATGALTPLLNTILGCRIPIQPGKGYSITMPRPTVCPRLPMILEECHVGITPFASGYRVGSTMEFAGYDATLNRRRLQYLRDGAAEYLVEPACEPVEEEWFGWRPMTWDGLPYIDRSPRLKNVWIVAGHNMLGLSMGTATGKLVSEMMNGQTPHINPEPFRIGR